MKFTWTRTPDGVVFSGSAGSASAFVMGVEEPLSERQAATVAAGLEHMYRQGREDKARELRDALSIGVEP